MEEDIPQPQIQTRWYSSLVNALGPDAPWLRHVNQVTMATDGESSQGPQFGPQPNNVYNISQNGGATPVETVEMLLGDAPNVASSSTPSSTDIASFFDDMGRCKLRDLDGIANPCSSLYVPQYGVVQTLRGGETHTPGSRSQVPDSRINACRCGDGYTGRRLRRRKVKEGPYQE